MKPFFSVIIPVYNKERYIKTTLESVLSQSFKDFEVIVVNDGSTDRSMDIVSTFHDDRIQIINKKNEGVSSARNLGIQNAKADFMALLDADDIWHQNHLEHLNRLIEGFPGCGLYCTAYETAYFNKKIVKGVYSGINKDFFGIAPNYFANCLVDDIALTSAVAIPKTILEKHGYFKTDLRSGQDTELWVRIALKEPVAFTSKISVKRIISNNGNHLSLSDKRSDGLKILEKFKESEETNESLKSYMDLVRFSVAMERKMNCDEENFKKIVRTIDFSNLNGKQKMILKLPGFIINILKRFQVFLIKKGIYLTPYR